MTLDDATCLTSSCRFISMHGGCGWDSLPLALASGELT